MPKEVDKYFLAFSELISTPPILKKSLFEFFNYDIERAWNCDKIDLKKFSLSYPEIQIPRTFLSAKEYVNPDYILEKVIKNKLNYITYDDDKYPSLLKEIPDYPLMLYYKGDLNLCH